MQNNNFDLLANLPAIFFAICFFINFLVFSWGGILLLLAKGDEYRIEKGKKIFSRSFTMLFIVILLLAVFFIITYLLQQGEVFKVSTQASEEFPPAYHLAVLPPAPEYIKLGNYYFTGPWKADLNDKIMELATYSILCKKGEEYDILYIDDSVRNAPARNEKYPCWIENCGNSLKNIYIAVLWTPSEKYNPIEKENMKKELINVLNPACKDAESEE